MCHLLAFHCHHFKMKICIRSHRKEFFFSILVENHKMVSPHTNRKKDRQTFQTVFDLFQNLRPHTEKEMVSVVTI